MKRLLRFFRNRRSSARADLVTSLAWQLYLGIIEVDEVRKHGSLTIGYVEIPELTLIHNRDTKRIIISCDGQILPFSTSEHADLFRELFLWNSSIFNYMRVQFLFEIEACNKLCKLFPMKREELVQLIQKDPVYTLDIFRECRARCLRNTE